VREYPNVPARFVAARNPTKGAQKETRNVTDRALRYRATAQPPPGERRCCLFGFTRNVEVGHVNGHEEDSSPANLFGRAVRATCDAGIRCVAPDSAASRINTIHHRKALPISARGLTSSQPQRRSGRKHGGKRTIAMIRATPPAQRSRFAKRHLGASTATGDRSDGSSLLSRLGFSSGRGVQFRRFLWALGALHPQNDSTMGSVLKARCWFSATVCHARRMAVRFNHARE
jgi:hypothetical protein